MVSINKILDWVGPLIFIGGAAYIYWAFTNKAWPFNQPTTPVTPQMMQMAMDMGVPVEELSRIPIDTTGIMTAIPGDQITPLVSTGLSPVLVPTMATMGPTPTDVMGISAPMPTPPPADGMGAGVPIGMPGSGGKPVVIGGTGASNQKSSPIPPVFSSPVTNMPVSIMTPSGLQQVMPGAAVPAAAMMDAAAMAPAVMMPSGNVQRNVMMNVSNVPATQTIMQSNVIGGGGGMVIPPRAPMIIPPRPPMIIPPTPPMIIRPQIPTFMQPSFPMFKPPVFPTIKIPTFPTIR